MRLQGTMASRMKCAALGMAAWGLCASQSLHAQDKPALTFAQIDHFIRAEWNKEGVVPSPAVDDARYLRRIYLDIVGTIPPQETVVAFLADTTPNKRGRAVDALLASPRYADNWTAYWNAVLMGRGRPNNAQVVDQSAFRGWLHGEFAQNAPWNKFVYDLISATGVNSEGGSYAKAAGAIATDAKTPAMRMQNGKPALSGAANTQAANSSAAKSSDAMMAGDGMMAANGAVVRTAVLPAAVNGATNWILKYQGNPQDLSGTASKLFLGVQIQCAQCHDHKTEKWKQEDFRRFTACFINTRPRPVDPTLTPEQLKGMIRQVDLVELPRPVPRRNPKAKKPDNVLDYVSATPAALDGTDMAGAANRRAALADWMTAPRNPWFAKAIVNRMWNHFLGRGFVEPIDDIRPSNAVIMPELLEALSQDFVARGYDLKYLIKEICATQVYQLSAAPAKKADTDNKLWARFRLKPMGPEELADSLVTATNMGPVLERIAGGRMDQIKFQMNKQFSFLFDVDEEFEQKDFEGTIPQALMLLNGNLVNRGATPIPGTALADILALPDDKAKITSLYLRTLSRMPTGAELARWTGFVNAPRYMSSAADTAFPVGAQSQTPQAIINGRNALAVRAARRNRLANRANNPAGTQGDTTNGAQTTSQMGNEAAMSSANDRKALAQAARPKKGNNGYDPLARLAPQAAKLSQTPETQAYEDLFWALLNSSEFLFNH